jgi:hypothetical protein
MVPDQLLYVHAQFFWIWTEDASALWVQVKNLKLELWLFSDSSVYSILWVRVKNLKLMNWNLKLMDGAKLDVVATRHFFVHDHMTFLSSPIFS